MQHAAHHSQVTRSAAVGFTFQLMQDNYRSIGSLSRVRGPLFAGFADALDALRGYREQQGHDKEDSDTCNSTTQLGLKGEALKLEKSRVTTTNEEITDVVGNLAESLITL